MEEECMVLMVQRMGAPCPVLCLTFPRKLTQQFEVTCPTYPTPPQKPPATHPPNYQRSEQFLKHKGQGAHLELGKRDAPGAEEAGEVGL